MPGDKTNTQLLMGLINNVKKENEFTEQDKYILAYYMRILIEKEKKIDIEHLEDNISYVEEFVLELIKENKKLEKELIIVEKK